MSASVISYARWYKDWNGKPLIDEAQFEAGERLHADYEFAQMGPRVTAAWSHRTPQMRARRGVPAAELRDAIVDARTCVQHALTAVGPEISGVLVDICCELKGLEEAEKENGWPRRAGTVVLQIALTRLCQTLRPDRRHVLIMARCASLG